MASILSVSIEENDRIPRNLVTVKDALVECKIKNRRNLIVFGTITLIEIQKKVIIFFLYSQNDTIKCMVQQNYFDPKYDRAVEQMQKLKDHYFNNTEDPDFARKMFGTEYAVQEVKESVPVNIQLGDTLMGDPGQRIFIEKRHAFYIYLYQKCKSVPHQIELLT